MDLSDLRIFMAVVDEGGILKAARKLHRVPSNITTRIRQLEASTNSQLFYRHKQRLAPVSRRRNADELRGQAVAPGG